ncbi:MAG: homoserine kinase [Planctomycetes bacterium]|nr:homoserine kinase [Planctomycetota bacterium]
MPPRAHPVRHAVSVAGSTSNLGPGFDLAGLALSMSLHAEIEPAPEAARDLLEVSGDAAPDWPLGPENLFLRAVHAALDELQGPRAPIRARIHSDIPVARGLGSSGAAIAAGLLLAEALAGRRLSLERRLRLGIDLEGHPDNVAAALCGGLTLCLPGDPPLLVRHDVHPSLAFAVAWPEAKLATPVARAALPATVAFADAVENARRLPLLLEGLRSGRPELLRAGGEDRLHVRYRLPLIRGGAEALAAARHQGALLATISGAGSALLAITTHAQADAIAEVMRLELARHGGAHARVLMPALGEPQVVGRPA